MKSTTSLFLIALILTLGLAGCPENVSTKNFGGQQTIELDCHEKFVNITWKKDDLWIVTTDMPEDHTPQTYHFREKSVYGVFAGDVEVRESHCKK